MNILIMITYREGRGFDQVGAPCDGRASGVTGKTGKTLEMFCLIVFQLGIHLICVIFCISVLFTIKFKKGWRKRQKTK